MRYQDRQLETIKNIEEIFKKGQTPSTVVEPVADYVLDDRICLTSIVFLPTDIEKEIIEKVIAPLKNADPSQYFYIPGSFHVTINNIRTIENPPLFDEKDIEKAREVVEAVVSKFNSFSFEIGRLFELPTSLAVCAFTDSILGNIALELRSELKKNGIADNKNYASQDVVIGSSTIARYTNTPNQKFLEKLKELREIIIGSFKAEKVSLITTNAVCHPSKTKIIDEFELNSSA